MMLGPDKLQIAPPNEWTDFQDLTRDLTAARLQGASVQNFGRPGQSQQGVDHFAFLPGGGILGVQCKKKDVLVGNKLTVRELVAEVGKAKSFTPKLTQYVLATTSMDDAALQREAAKITERHARKGLFEVIVEGWDTIRLLLGTHPQVSQKYYGYPPKPSSMTVAFEERTAEPSTPRRVKGRRQGGRPSKSAPVLSPGVHHALGLLVAIGVPFSRAMLSQLIPEIDWGPFLRRLRRSGHVSAGPHGYEPTLATRRSIFPTDDDRRPFDEEWARVLAPLGGHIDTGMLLAGVLMRLGESSQAIEVLARLAEAVEPGPWTETLLAVILVFDKKDFLKGLPAADRLSLLYAGAACLSRTNRFADAREWASRLRDEAVRAAASWYAAEADLLTGIVHDREGDTTRAMDFFRKAADRAMRHRHHLLRGHALNNLALMLSRTDPAAAETVLAESLKAKRRAGETGTSVSALIGFGLAAANSGRFLQAKRFFLKAVALAERIDDRLGRSMAECNVGAALLDLGDPAEALLHYGIAKQVAETERFGDALPIAARGVALALSRLGRHKSAEKAFQKCCEVELAAGNTLGAVVALHDVAASQLYQRRHAEARSTLRRAGRLSRVAGDTEWLLRCLNDEALCHRDAGDIGAAAALLERRVEEAEAERDYFLAASLSESLASLWEDTPAESSRVEAAFKEAERCWRRIPDVPERLWQCLGRLFEWRWRTGRSEPAIGSLRKMVAAAQETGLREEIVRSLGQLASCLQELGRHAEAEPLHRRALKLARTLGHQELLEHNLNNLGELYRRQGKQAKAESLFKECETSARARGDVEAALSTAQNRALLLLDAGRLTAARKLLSRCRDQARLGKHWGGYVRSVRGLADIAASDGDDSAAIRGYRRAIAVAESHGLEDQLWPARVDLAALLHSAGNVADAIRELEAAQDSFATEPDASRFTAFLARSYRDAGRHREADAAWGRAAEQAKSAGDDETVLAAAAESAKSLARRTGFREGNRALLAAVRSKAPAACVVLSRTGLELALDHREYETAGKWFKKAIQAAGRAGALEDEVDAHMLFGDGLWSAPGYRVLAVQAFVAGQARAVAVSEQAFIDAGFHLLWKLLHLRQAARDELERETLAWLRGSEADLSDSARLVMWPFRVSRKAGETRGLQPATAERRVLRAFKDEFG